MSIAIKRVYEPAAPADGYRVLIDRLWPRGLKKEAVPLDLWAKELAPSTALRQWFGHDPALWDGFRHRYASELDQLAEYWQPLAQRAARHPLTLLYGARDEEHNNAVAMKAYLENWLHSHGPR
ncbi:DUF488 domain-containing protein [Rhodanobacter sp. AS-Z3]|uniref:DUF488 domain-containing protein n=1 Tax=Rhodanobacter sp. AS-Z3 TaxID=3031330 RepID=UPI00247B16D1|nr:DUF488 domain-containing protein [Rhodanobacter sp. AS-Z3]WEN15472.1 DUF488 domain-containing protein [Rhodanobacter sp. AS-Z3]